jgi:hypothetical protein
MWLRLKTINELSSAQGYYDIKTNITLIASLLASRVAVSEESTYEWVLLFVCTMLR